MLEQEPFRPEATERRHQCVKDPVKRESKCQAECRAKDETEDRPLRVCRLRHPDQKWNYFREHPGSPDEQADVQKHEAQPKTIPHRNRTAEFCDVLFVGFALPRKSEQLHDIGRGVRVSRTIAVTGRRRKIFDFKTDRIRRSGSRPGSVVLLLNKILNALDRM